MNTSNNTLNGTTTYIITIYSSKHNSTSFEMDLTPQRFLSFTSDNEFTRCDYINITVDEGRTICAVAIPKVVEEAVFYEEELLEDRKSLENGTVNFSQIVAQRQLSLNLSGVKPISRWITPKGGSRRYDTYFFVAQSFSSVAPRVDGKEAVEVFWITPSEALQKWESGELTMISPTLATLQQLQTYRSTEEVFSVLDSKPLPENIRIVDESQALPLFPDDENYEASYTWPALGWTWLPKKAQ